MFLWSASLRNRFTIAVCVLAVASGCAMQRFLRVEERQIDARLRFFLGGGGNSLVLTHGKQAFLIDVKFAGASKSLRHRVETELERSVRRAMVTHSHFDHAGGLDEFRNLGPVLIHPNARQRLEADGVRAQWIDVEGPLELQLEDEIVRVWHPGTGHTDGDLVAYLVHRKLLVTGDLVSADMEPVIDVEAGGDVLAWAGTLKGLLELDFVTALPGHGPPIGRDTLVRLHEYLTLLEREVSVAQQQGLSEDDVVAKVSLVETPALEPVPFAANREKTIRLMDRALRARRSTKE
ncbi:MAG: MBL fold metallo-hydrolase [Myxococcales bacterium]|nr:MBL fold metallo-hydrolase [Myxococcales bacterium]